MPAQNLPPESIPPLFETPHWRAREHDAAVPAALLAEQERELGLFRRVLEDARNRDTPLRDLFSGMIHLAMPGLSEEERQRAAARCEEETLRWLDSMDEEGNPRWISLTLVDRRSETDGIKPGSVLPDEQESAAPKNRLHKDAENSSEIPKRENFLFSGLEFIVRRFKKDGKEDRPKPGDVYRGKGTLPPPRPRPMRGFFRILVVSICLGVIYHIVSRKGWVPRIF